MTLSPAVGFLGGWLRLMGYLAGRSGLIEEMIDDLAELVADWRADS